MTTKIRATLLTIFLFFGLLTCLQAQDKYEYAIINYIPVYKDLAISINGVSYKEMEIPKEKVQGNADANAALEEMNKMIEEGWELFDTAIGNGGTGLTHIYVFYLRKKVG